jgi:hypothetical protein
LLECGVDVEVEEELIGVKYLIRSCKKIIKEENRVVKRAAKRLRQYSWEALAKSR